mmetsp:Transcript_41663/g.87412  ORF Transcript_41663/g.87412 Transcript_41663/m.87412 type:complete len:500 (+) Transcript_41663:130-1629(+)
MSNVHRCSSCIRGNNNGIVNFHAKTEIRRRKDLHRHHHRHPSRCADDPSGIGCCHGNASHCPTSTRFNTLRATKRRRRRRRRSILTINPKPATRMTSQPTVHPTTIPTTTTMTPLSLPPKRKRLLNLNLPLLKMLLYLASCTTSLFPLLQPIPTVDAMIYLEDPEGALRYDALPEYVPPEPPSGTTTEGSSWTWIPQEEPTQEDEDEEHYYDDGMEKLYKLGTPDHYLTLATRPPTPMPSSSTDVPTMGMMTATTDTPSEMPSEDLSSVSEMPSISASGIPQGDNTTISPDSPTAVTEYDSSTNLTTPNATADATLNTTTSNATNINTISANTTPNNSSSNAEQNYTASENNHTMIDSTQQHDNNRTNSSSLFDRALEAHASSTQTESPTESHETNTPTTDPLTITITNAPTIELFAPSTQPSTSPHPTKLPSVIPEITGEYTHHLGDIFDNERYHDHYYDYRPYGYFYDQKLIHNPNKKIVMYDSKQARFGVDLGPRG